MTYDRREIPAHLLPYFQDAELGLEATVQEYVERLVGVFREVRRTLRDDGTLWLNLGDSYAGSPSVGYRPGIVPGVGGDQYGARNRNGVGAVSGLKPKDLIGVPWRVAFALQADGWWLRDAIVWCLAASTRVYAKTQKREMPMTIHDLVRLDPKTVRLWNGERWTQVLGWGPSRCDRPVRLTLRSGERINSTPNHEWPLADGRVVRAELLQVGDVLQTCSLPEPQEPIGQGIDADLAWFAGLYLAEGSHSADAIQIAGNVSETARMERVDAIARRYGGSSVIHIGPGLSASQVVHGPILEGVLRFFVAGRTAHDKHLHSRCWALPNHTLRAFLEGYLDGDGSRQQHRVRLGFTRNVAWANDLRTLAARLDATLTLNPSLAKMGQARVFEAYRGEIRFSRSGHPNEKERAEVVAIDSNAPGTYWDISVEDEPHTFALASGVLTHNCKPNPMPSSVKDRCTSSYEMVFMLAKSARYFSDMDAVREPLSGATLERIQQAKWKSGEQAGSTRANGEAKTTGPMRAVVNAKGLSQPPQIEDGNYSEAGANLRNVWTIATTPFTGWTKTVRRAPVAAGERGDDVRETSESTSHFATMPLELALRCIRIGTRVGDVVLDPFMGSGTTAEAAESIGRAWVGYELNPEYHALIAERVRQLGLFGAAEILPEVMDGE